MFRLIFSLVILAGWLTTPSRGSDPEDAGRVRKAIAYLDARQEAWSQFAKAERGEGETKTTCVSCHTGISYTLTRPSLGLGVERTGPAEPERRRIESVSLRVNNWSNLDTPRFKLMYDSNDRKKA